MNRQLNVGDLFGEYNSMLNAGYPRYAHSEQYIKYFWDGYGKRAFFTKEELLDAHPDAYCSVGEYHGDFLEENYGL